MAEGSSSRPAAGGKKRRPGQTAPKKKRPPQSGTGPTAAKPAAEEAQPEKQLPWAMRRPLPPNYPGAKRPVPKPRTRRDRIDTIRYLLIIGTVLSAVGVVGSLVGVMLAMGNDDYELPFGDKYAIPIEFLLAIVVVYILLTAVDGSALYFLRQGRMYTAVRICMFGGLGMFAVVVMGIIASFGQQGFLLAIAVAYALPYVLGPLIVAVPVTAATGYMALSQRHLYKPGH
jgi:hypothetical protein